MSHPRRGDAEYVLTVRCDDPSHEAAVDIEYIGYWPEPERGGVGFLEWLSSGESLQTPFGEKLKAERRAARRSGRPIEHVDLGGFGGTPVGMDQATRWRLECPSCRLTVVIHGAKMDKALNALRHAGIQVVTLWALAAAGR